MLEIADLREKGWMWKDIGKKFKRNPLYLCTKYNAFCEMYPEKLKKGESHENE